MELFRRLILYIFISTVFIGAINESAYAQAGDQGFRFGGKLPYTYDIGYYQRFSTRIGMYVGTQIVTLPFSGTITGIMNLYGADPDMTAILRESMNFGIGLDHGWQYYFGTDNRRYYVGLGLQWMMLPKQDIDDEIINNAFANNPVTGCETLDDCPVNPMHKFNDSDKLTINTNYVNMSLNVGMTFVLAKDAELRIEGAIAKTIASRHYLYSDYRYISPYTEKTNESLQSIMMKYGWFPSINVYYIYKLNL